MESVAEGLARHRQDIFRIYFCLRVTHLCIATHWPKPLHLVTVSLCRQRRSDPVVVCVCRAAFGGSVPSRDKQQRLWICDCLLTSLIPVAWRPSVCWHLLCVGVGVCVCVRVCRGVNQLGKDFSVCGDVFEIESHFEFCCCRLLWDSSCSWALLHFNDQYEN